nr:putative ribonuclease H protein At1g65750 family [Tanacetum cinerariifolium]GEZ63280.1 putative ribonuclease H protein At1g65750 family [Tanacetum cinerariifolium]
MARWMRCGTGEFSFTYFGLPIKVCMRKENAWRMVYKKFKKRFSEWKARSMSFGGVFMVGVGAWGGNSSVKSRSSVWADIIRVGCEIDKTGVEFSTSFIGKVESNKEVLVCNREEWDKGVLKWKWEWLRDLRGRATGEVGSRNKVEQVSAKEGKFVRVESVIGEAPGLGRVR